MEFLGRVSELAGRLLLRLANQARNSILSNKILESMPQIPDRIEWFCVQGIHRAYHILLDVVLSTKIYNCRSYAVLYPCPSTWFELGPSRMSGGRSNGLKCVGPTPRPAE